jgi:hypothetical protein
MIVKIVPQNLQQKVKDLRVQALTRLHDSEWRRIELTKEEIGQAIVSLVSTGVSYEVVNQVNRDLRLYNVWDSIAMWTDIDSGLICFAPEPIILLVEAILEKLEKRYHNEA